MIGSIMLAILKRTWHLCVFCKGVELAQGASLNNRATLSTSWGQLIFLGSVCQGIHLQEHHKKTRKIHTVENS